MLIFNIKEQNLYKGKVFVDVDLFSTDKLTLESMCKPTIQLAVIENDITSHDSSATKFGDENTGRRVYLTTMLYQF